MADSPADGGADVLRSPVRPDDLRRALVEQFLRNGDSGDDAANSDLVAEVCASIRRAQDAAQDADGAPGVS